MLDFLFIAPFSQELEPPPNPGRFIELGGFGVLQGFIPFAFAEGGNYVCIEVATGRVFFWDHEIEVEQGGLVKIADDIPKFLESMKPFDKSKIKLKSDQVKSAWIDPDFLDEL